MEWYAQETTFFAICYRRWGISIRNSKNNYQQTLPKVKKVYFSSVTTAQRELLNTGSVLLCL